MKIIVGIDISKATIDAFMTGGKARSFANSRAGFGQLLKWSKGAELYVMEATGAYHFALADHLHGAGQKISVVNPRMASHYAKALGLCHKTDQRGCARLGSVRGAQRRAILRARVRPSSPAEKARPAPRANGRRLVRAQAIA